MKNENDKERRTTSVRGSIALEYVVAMGGIAAALVVFLNRAFYNPGDGFGPLGQNLVAFFQRLQGGLSLPIP